MTKTLKNATMLIITGIVLFWGACSPSADSKNFQEGLDDINAQIKEALQQVEQLQNEEDVSRFSSKTKILLGSIDNQIEQYHLLMDKTNQKIDKEARDRIIGFKQKKAEVEFKLALLDDAGVYIRERDTLTYADTVSTSRNASGSAVSHNIEPLETDETEVATKRDTTLPYIRMSEWKYAGFNYRDELLKDLQEIQEEIELFRKRNL